MASAVAVLAVLGGWNIGTGEAVAAPPGEPSVPLTKPKNPGPINREQRLPTGPADYIVRFKPGVSPDRGGQTARAKGAQIKGKIRKVFPGAIIHLTPAQRDDLVKDPSVAYVEPDTVVSASEGSQQNPPSWGLDRVDNRALPLNRDYSWGPNGAGVRAYIIDSGIYGQHTDFGGRVAGGIDFVGDGWGTNDCNGHGTHVAGTVGGARSGVAKGVTLVPMRVLACDGRGYVSSTIQALDWIAMYDSAHSVVNLSLGGGYSQAENDAVQAVINSGDSVAVAAGNEADNACNHSPASAPNALTVAATDSTDTEPNFSNYGSCVDLYAPGVGIVSASNSSSTGYVSFQGTSMASPHVAGAAALILSVHRDWSAYQVSAELLGKATTGVVKNAYSVNRLLFTGGGSTKAPLWPAPIPTVSGTATMGSTLTGRFGTWGPYPLTLKYQWQRMFGTTVTNIAGATGTSYRLTASDVGARVRATVVGYAADYAAVGRVSTWSSVVTGSITGTVPTITGTAKVGQQLKANAGTWSPSPVTLRYQWYRVSSTGAMSAISGATWSQYGLTASDLNYSIRVSVTGTRPYFANVMKVSATTAKVGLGTLTAGTPTISGTTRVSYTVTANPGAWGPAPVALRYQWYKVSSTGATTIISGATASSYQLPSGLRGYRLRVTVTGAKTGYTTTYRWSGTSATVI